MVIHPAPGLDLPRYRRALAAGPRAVGTRRRTYEEMLAKAGFAKIQATDLTADYRATLSSLLRQQQLRKAELVRLTGAAAFAERQAELRGALAAIEEGILARSLYLGSRGHPMSGT